MRQIEINSDKLFDILEERGHIFKAINKINKQLYELDEERKKLSYKMDRLKEKTVPIVDKNKKNFNLGEFEIISRVYINGEKKPEVEIIDLVEEYKNELRKKETENDKNGKK